MAKRKQLPPLQSLVFFEAAARHLNFTAAALELSTTQPAVSHRIGWLERDLGAPLFKRQHRGVSLTPAGVRLFEAVYESLNSIGAAAEEIRSHRKVLTVATDFGFAAYWLMPRLAALRQLMPDLDVRILTSQNEIDMRHESADIAIAFGTGKWPGCEVRLLFPEIVVPVCSPAFYAAQRLSGDAALLTSLPLLHLERPESSRWLSWDDWFGLHHLVPTHSHHDVTFNSYPLVIQAAMGSQGVALGWLPLVGEALRSDQLVMAIRRSIRTERGYFLLEPTSATQTPLRTLFRRWVLKECRKSLAENAAVPEAPSS